MRARRAAPRRACVTVPVFLPKLPFAGQNLTNPVSSGRPPAASRVPYRRAETDDGEADNPGVSAPHAGCPASSTSITSATPVLEAMRAGRLKGTGEAGMFFARRMCDGPCRQAAGSGRCAGELREAAGGNPRAVPTGPLGTIHRLVGLRDRCFHGAVRFQARYPA